MYLYEETCLVLMWSNLTNPDHNSIILIYQSVRNMFIVLLAALNFVIYWAKMPDSCSIKLLRCEDLLLSSGLHLYVFMKTSSLKMSPAWREIVMGIFTILWYLIV